MKCIESKFHVGENVELQIHYEIKMRNIWANCVLSDAVLCMCSSSAPNSMSHPHLPSKVITNNDVPCWPEFVIKAIF